MRRALAAFVATVAGLVLLLSFKTTSGKSTNRPVALSGATAGTADSSPPDSAAPQSPTPSASTKPASGTKTVTGSSVAVTEGFRRFGSVQVKVTLTNGKITNLVAVDYPRNDPQSAEISQYSIPILQQEVLAAQGTHIDAISGATYTSEAYAQSVQAALDRAKS
jgi:uncharacterized protein with FMN-binding domain